MRYELGPHVAGTAAGHVADAGNPATAFGQTVWKAEA